MIVLDGSRSDLRRTGVLVYAAECAQRGPKWFMLQNVHKEGLNGLCCRMCTKRA